MRCPLLCYVIRHPFVAYRHRRRQASDRRVNAWLHAVEAYRVREWR